MNVVMIVMMKILFLSNCQKLKNDIAQLSLACLACSTLI